MLKIIRIKVIVLEMLVSLGLIIGALNLIVSELRQGVPSKRSNPWAIGCNACPLANRALVLGVVVHILQIFFNSK
jgi:hypothetical protein